MLKELLIDTHTHAHKPKSAKYEKLTVTFLSYLFKVAESG